MLPLDAQDIALILRAGTLADHPHSHPHAIYCFSEDPPHAHLSCEMMTTMLYPAQLSSLCINLHKAVLVLDLSRPAAPHFLAGDVQNLIAGAFP